MRGKAGTDVHGEPVLIELVDDGHGPELVFEIRILDPDRKFGTFLLRVADGVTDRLDVLGVLLIGKSRWRHRKRRADCEDECDCSERPRSAREPLGDKTSQHHDEKANGGDPSIEVLGGQADDILDRHRTQDHDYRGVRPK